MRMNDDGKTVAAADMLVPGIEELMAALSGRSADKLGLRRVEGLDTEYQWYLTCAATERCATPASSPGFERMLMYFTDEQYPTFNLFPPWLGDG